MDLRSDGDFSADKVPDFNTLSEIMAYFKTVPFETFKEKLNSWFLNEIPNKRPDLIKQNGEIDLPADLFDLIEGIFKKAEEKGRAKLN